MKRTPLPRSRPPKRPAYHAVWKVLNPRCWLCGSTYNLATHEIPRGPHREKAVQEPAAWVRTCRDCHRDKLDSMPIVRQLALKRIHDPDHYNRVAVNLLRNRRPNAITKDEVLVEVAKLKRAGYVPEGGNDG